MKGAALPGWQLRSAGADRRITRPGQQLVKPPPLRRKQHRHQVQELARHPRMSGCLQTGTLNRFL